MNDPGGIIGMDSSGSIRRSRKRSRQEQRLGSQLRGYHVLDSGYDSGDRYLRHHQYYQQHQRRPSARQNEHDNHSATRRANSKDRRLYHDQPHHYTFSLATTMTEHGNLIKDEDVVISFHSGAGAFRSANEEDGPEHDEQDHNDNASTNPYDRHNTDYRDQELDAENDLSTTLLLAPPGYEEESSSESPSGGPSDQTIAPSAVPSKDIALTLSSSVAPSSELPTAKPSAVPTLSNLPTMEPTETPSVSTTSSAPSHPPSNSPFASMPPSVAATLGSSDSPSFNESVPGSGVQTDPPTPIQLSPPLPSVPSSSSTPTSPPSTTFLPTASPTTPMVPTLKPTRFSELSLVGNKPPTALPTWLPTPEPTFDDSAPTSSDCLPINSYEYGKIPLYGDDIISVPLEYRYEIEFNDGVAPDKGVLQDEIIPNIEIALNEEILPSLFDLCQDNEAISFRRGLQPAAGSPIVGISASPDDIVQEQEQCVIIPVCTPVLGELKIFLFSEDSSKSEEAKGAVLRLIERAMNRNALKSAHPDVRDVAFLPAEAPIIDSSTDNPRPGPDLSPPPADLSPLPANNVETREEPVMQRVKGFPAVIVVLILLFLAGLYLIYRGVRRRKEANRFESVNKSRDIDLNEFTEVEDGAYIEDDAHVEDDEYIDGEPYPIVAGQFIDGEQDADSLDRRHSSSTQDRSAKSHAHSDGSKSAIVRALDNAFAESTGEAVDVEASEYRDNDEYSQPTFDAVPEAQFDWPDSPVSLKDQTEEADANINTASRNNSRSTKYSSSKGSSGKSKVTWGENDAADVFSAEKVQRADSRSTKNSKSSSGKSKISWGENDVHDQYLSQVEGETDTSKPEHEDSLQDRSSRTLADDVAQSKTRGLQASRHSSRSSGTWTATPQDDQFSDGFPFDLNASEASSALSKKSSTNSLEGWTGRSGTSLNNLNNGDPAEAIPEEPRFEDDSASKRTSTSSIVFPDDPTKLGAPPPDEEVASTRSSMSSLIGRKGEISGISEHYQTDLPEGSRAPTRSSDDMVRLREHLSRSRSYLRGEVQSNVSSTYAAFEPQASTEIEGDTSDLQDNVSPTYAASSTYAVFEHRASTPSNVAKSPEELEPHFEKESDSAGEFPLLDEDGLQYVLQESLSRKSSGKSSSDSVEGWAGLNVVDFSSLDNQFEKVVKDEWDMADLDWGTPNSSNDNIRREEGEKRASGKTARRGSPSLHS